MAEPPRSLVRRGVASSMLFAALSSGGCAQIRDADEIEDSASTGPGVGPDLATGSMTSGDTMSAGVTSMSTGSASESSGTSGAGDETPSFDDAQRVQLVRADGWQSLEVQSDPFLDRPTPGSCENYGWYVEFSTLEVDTELCPYAHLWQPSSLDVPAGWALQVRYSHKVLVADAPARGHFGLAVGGVVIADAWVEIPSPAQVDTVTVPLPPGRSLLAGAPVVLHLHNHGYNTWRVLEVSAVPPAIHGGE